MSQFHGVFYCQNVSLVAMYLHFQNEFNVFITHYTIMVDLIGLLKTVVQLGKFTIVLAKFGS